MIPFKLSVEKKLLYLYSICLNKNFFLFLNLIDLLLPKNEFRITEKKIPKNQSEQCVEQLLPEFAQEIMNSNIGFEQIDTKTLIFFIPNSSQSLTKTTISNLAMSLTNVKRIDFIVLTRFGEVILSSKTCKKFLNAEDIIAQKVDYIFFEIHTIFDNKGLLEETTLQKLKVASNAKIIGICFDIWREFDISFIAKWNNISDYFIHMDNKSVSTYLLNSNKMIFWPFAGWVQNILPNSYKNKVIYFSGNLRPSDRRFILKKSKKFANKLQVDLRINKVDHSDVAQVSSEDMYLNKLNNSQFILGLVKKVSP